jgi:hypothetical protein
MAPYSSRLLAAVLVPVLVVASGCAMPHPSPALAHTRAIGEPSADCPPRRFATMPGAPGPAGAPPPPGLVPSNASRVVADVLHYSVSPPPAPRDTPPVHPEHVRSSLTIIILASADQSLGQSNLAVPGSTVEALSCGALSPGLTGKRIEAILTLTGDTQGTRWWISNVRVLP